MKKLSFILAIVMVFSMYACNKQTDMTHGDPNANRDIPNDSQVTLTINKDINDSNKKVFGIGTELDPHFFYGNVGRSGANSSGSWICKEEDWELFDQRISEMNLKRIRMMMLPSWFAPSESNYITKNYDYASNEMNSVYKTLETAKKYGIKVNITMWGVDCTWLRTPDRNDWVTYPVAGKEEVFVEMFADVIKYLIEEKDFENITDVTLYNEPNAFYYGNRAINEYVDICIKMDGAFKKAGIRDKVLFNLSDDARDTIWLAKSLYMLEGVIDIANSHTYSFGNTYDKDNNVYSAEMSNQEICYDLPNYNLALYQEAREGYENIPHIFGEFGTLNGIGSHTATDIFKPERGIELSRIALNMFNMGSVGVSYWVLFSQYYSAAAFENIMNMGLWGFADENYNCRPMYYAFSMMTRFIEEGDKIYIIKSNDGNIVATAFRNGEKWSYLVVNDGNENKKVSFLNETAFATEFKKYVYDIENIPTDNKVITSSKNVTADGRVLSDTVKGKSFAVYTTK